MKPKFCSDLEQSKKLKEILPIESADMHYAKVINGFDQSKDWVYEIQLCAPSEKNHIPAWSLAALLDYLSANFRIDIKYLDNYLELDCRVQVTYNKELIDACVEMIIKLKDKKLL